MKYVSFAFVVPTSMSPGFGYITWSGELRTIDDIERLIWFIRQNKDGMRDAGISILSWQLFDK